MKDAEFEDGSGVFILSFRKFDKDKDGLLSYQELKMLIESFKYPCSEAELQDYVNDVNINENGEIDEEAFLEIIANIQEEKETDEEIKEAFRIFDKNNNRLLTPKNVFDVFKKIDETIKEEEVLQIFKECDLDRDGYLNEKEFARMIKNK